MVDAAGCNGSTGSGLPSGPGTAAPSSHLVHLQAPRAVPVGPPYSSLLNQLPNRPSAWASGSPRASASATKLSGSPRCRRPIQAPERTAGHRAPDAQAAVPDLRPLPEAVPRAEVLLRRGDQAVDPGADDAERDGPDGQVEHDPRGGAPGAHPALGDHAGHHHAEDDAQRVRPQRKGAHVHTAVVGLGRAARLFTVAHATAVAARCTPLGGARFAPDAPRPPGRSAALRSAAAYAGWL